MTLLSEFRDRLRDEGLEGLRAGLIGRGATIDAGFGARPLLYADYVASGRALAQVEDVIRDRVLPFYANTHTQASWCGAYMTRLREQARAEILRLVGADQSCHAIFAGSGATSGVNLLLSQLQVSERVRAGERITVLIGPYEHHSNILPWRESGASVVEIPEGPKGGPDLDALEACLDEAASNDLVIGAFSAASNVTGIITDTDAVTRCLKARGALAIWDYAGGGPYLPIRMNPAPDCRKDAVVFSPHKFPGGPGASGVIVLRDTVLRNPRPHRPGGGTVSFVSPGGHDYAATVEAREEGGTPNVIGDIRAALAMLVKDAIGEEAIGQIDCALRMRAVARWSKVPRLRLLGHLPEAEALPIFSMQLLDAAGRPVHHQLVTRLLSDAYGIQGRGGCACAGPYAHRLLQIDAAASERIRQNIRQGNEIDRPGWFRLNLSYLHSEEEIDHVLSSLPDLAEKFEQLARRYTGDAATARFALQRSA